MFSMNESIQHKQQRSQRSDLPICETPLVHLDNVRQVQPDILPTAKAQQMAEFFGALADHSLKITLSIGQSRTVCLRPCRCCNNERVSYFSSVAHPANAADCQVSS
jgi:hypothetical protein